MSEPAGDGVQVLCIKETGAGSGRHSGARQKRKRQVRGSRVGVAGQAGNVIGFRGWIQMSSAGKGFRSEPAGGGSPPRAPHQRFSARIPLEQTPRRGRRGVGRGRCERRGKRKRRSPRGGGGGQRGSVGGRRQTAPEPRAAKRCKGRRSMTACRSITLGSGGS